jgi:hypothetical protein
VALFNKKCRIEDNHFDCCYFSHAIFYPFNYLYPTDLSKKIPLETKVFQSGKNFPLAAAGLRTGC